MHQHTLESEDIERKIKKEGKDADDLVDKAKADIKSKVKDREHLKRQIQEHSGSQEVKDRLMQELEKAQADIFSMINHDASD